MNTLRPSARRLIAALSGAALAITVFALIRAGLPTLSHLGLIFGLAALVALTWLFPLPISFKTHLYLDTTIVTTAILMLQPGYAMLVAGVGAALAHRIRREDAAQTIFNT